MPAVSKRHLKDDFVLQLFRYIVSYLVIVSYFFTVSLFTYSFICLPVDFADFYLSCIWFPFLNLLECTLCHARISGVDSLTKRRWLSSERIVEKNPKGNQDPVLWAWLEMIFYPQEVYQSSVMVLSCGPFEVGHPKRFQKRVFYPPERYNEYLCPFCMGVPPDWSSYWSPYISWQLLHWSVYLFSWPYGLPFGSRILPIAHLLSSENRTKLDILLMYNQILSTKMCGD